MLALQPCQSFSTRKEGFMVRPFRSFRSLVYLIPLWMMFSPASADAQINFMGHQFCCPPTYFCVPNPPKLKYKCVCPKPVCDPCNLEHYGYYPTCWRPWLEQVNYSHCPVPPPTLLAPHYHPREAFSEEQPDEQLQSPGRVKPQPDKEVSREIR